MANKPRIASTRKLIVTGLIETEDDIRSGIKAIRRKCPDLRRVHDLVGDPPLRRRPAGFEGLARIIVAQQLSVASASAIWNRLEVAIAPVSPETLLAASDETLRACGLSAGKVRTLRNIAKAVIADELQIEKLGSLSDEAIHEQLTHVNGIGPWTADIFLMFCLGRRDAFAAGDLALQVAADSILQLGGRPSATVLLEVAERWRPWRGVAARLLWAYIPVLKKRDTALPV